MLEQIQFQIDELRNAGLSLETTRKAFELWRTCERREQEIRDAAKDDGERRGLLRKSKELDYLCASILCHFSEQKGIDPRSVKYAEGYTGKNLMPDGRKQWEHDADLLGMAIRSAEATAVPPSEPTPVDDPTAYRLASDFVDNERFPNLKAIRKALDANPSIRWRRPTAKNGKPIRNRLEIHAGDWTAFIRKLTADPLDLPASVVDAVMETENRKDEIRKQKENAGK